MVPFFSSAVGMNDSNMQTLSALPTLLMSNSMTAFFNSDGVNLYLHKRRN